MIKKLALTSAICIAGLNVSAQNMFSPVSGASNGLPTSLSFVHMAVGDVDGDGDLDVYISGTQSNDFIGKLFLNNGYGLFTEKTNANLIGTSYGSSEFADVDGDGDLDLVICGRSATNPSVTIVTRVYKNDGTGVFTLTNNNLVGVEGGQLATGDIDGDGDVDLVITGFAAGNVRTTKVYKNDGNGTFTEFAAGLPNLSKSTIALGNVDHDYPANNTIDYVIGGEGATNTAISVYNNSGTGAATLITNYALPNTSEGMIRLFDYDNDGDLDLIVTGGDYASRIFRNNGAGQYLANADQLPAFNFCSVAVGDFNGDGYKDFIINGRESSNQKALIFINNAGDGTFTQHSQVLSGGQRGNIVTGDFDSDGDLDIIVAGNGMIQYFRNGPCAIQLPASLPTLNVNCAITNLNQITNPTVTDCNGLTISPANANANLPINGSGVVTWTYSYEGENYELTQNVTVSSHSIAPTPTVASLSAIESNCALGTLTAPTATSHCGAPIAGTPNTNNFSQSTTIVWTYTDNLGNTATQEQILTILYPLNNEVANDGNGTLTSMETDEFVEFQWYDCDDEDRVLPNSSSRTFIAPSTGTYKVRLRNDQCERFSVCYTVDYLSTNQLSTQNWTIFPNPTTGQITLTGNASISEGTVEVLDGVGRVIATSSLNQEGNQTMTLEGAPGIYSIRITSEQGTTVQRVIKH